MLARITLPLPMAVPSLPVHMSVSSSERLHILLLMALALILTRVPTQVALRLRLVQLDLEVCPRPYVRLGAIGRRVAHHVRRLVVVPRRGRRGDRDRGRGVGTGRPVRVRRGLTRAVRRLRLRDVRVRRVGKRVVLELGLGPGHARQTLHRLLLLGLRLRVCLCLRVCVWRGLRRRTVGIRSRPSTRGVAGSGISAPDTRVRVV